jgi:hypothetical protein
MLKYVFYDTSLLVEALTHSSYNITGITACNEVNLDDLMHFNLQYQFIIFFHI